MSDRPAPFPTDTLVGLGGAAVLAAGLMASRGPLAGGLVGGVATAGLLLRWGSAPPLALLVATYLSLFPDGLPLAGPVGRGLAGPDLLDLLTVGAAVAYAAGHYRSLARADGEGDEPTADDLAGLFGGVAVTVLVGAAALILTTRYRPDYNGRLLRLLPVDEDASEPLDRAFTRFVLLAGLVGGGALVAGLGLWLTRLNRLTPAEAGLLLLDTGWQESRRELARLETWRAAATAPRQSRPRRRPRIWRSVGIGLLVFAATFVVFLCVLSRLR